VEYSAADVRHQHALSFITGTTDAATMNASDHVLWWPTMFHSNVSASIQQGAEAGTPSSAF